MGYKTYTCPIARLCGGCEWLAVPYPIQLRRKQERVAELLGALVEADGGELGEIRGMQEPVAYRHKAATPFVHARGGRVLSGFWKRGTHQLVPCDSCLVEDPRAREALLAVASVAEDMHIPPYNEDRDTGVLRHAIVRAGRATDELMVVVVTRTRELRGAERFAAELVQRCPSITTVVHNVNERPGNAILGRRSTTLLGPGVIHDVLLGCTFEIGPTSFYQTNPEQTEVLYRLAIDGLALDDQDGNSGAPDKLRVLDAYCGTGTIGTCLAAADARVEVVGVDRVSNAISCAGRNARANGVAERTSWMCADATEWMERTGRGAALDAVIMDPPRAGSTPEFIQGVVGTGARRVSYVSCDLDTLARDVALFRTLGYRVKRVDAVDMFPHTKHIECVCLLERACCATKHEYRHL